MKDNHKLADKYNPKEFEEKLYEEWEKNGYFKPCEDKEKETFTIMMPPPNVTGKLHMGHALDGTIQDILIRFKRMQGYRTLWLPGTDHASISTEMKVVQKLANDGIKKEDLGRERFIEEAWAWTKEYGGTIQTQQRKLGCSCDWERNRFTLDEGMSDAVLEQFIKLYEKGLIYKGKRMVNWCTSCNTSISDAEVEYHEEPSHLWHIRYKIKNEDRFIIVATTRPETMLGDTAVAVHPEDERYKDLVGKTCILPIMNKEIPIIADDFVEKDFGTGCVKITPAHDVNDYQAGLRHNLETIEVFDENFKMGDLVPEYKGMELLEARKLIVEKLKEIGALVKEEEYTHNVAKCERCKHTIEPKISTQWFVSMKDLAKRAADSVRNDETRFVPKRYEKQYFHWLDNIQDWCISRQLWWGHRIPAYYCKECGEVHVAKTNPCVCKKCGNANLEQDPDTLDTWFSSALWPFSTLGWPNTENEDYKDFYPTNVLVTGFDIITFWVSRMMTQGLEFTDIPPFKDVLIHGIVRDSEGRKMSKTLGNGVDPIDVINDYSADALRFSVISGTTMGNDIRYMPEKLDQASNFANKIWNAAKFITINLADDEKIMAFAKEIKNKETGVYKSESLRVEDRWILNKLDNLIKEVTENIENYDLGIALDKIYNFIWNEFCDWYIEIAKSRLYSENEEEKVQVSFVLNYVFGDSLKLLHPFMPFVTEEIYQMITRENTACAVASWPVVKEEYNHSKAMTDFTLLMDIIRSVRNIRAEVEAPMSKQIRIFINAKSEEALENLTTNQAYLQRFCNPSELVIEKGLTVDEETMTAVVTGADIFLPTDGLIDVSAEIERLNAELKKLAAEVKRGESKLANEKFVAKAPAHLVEEERHKLSDYKEKYATVEARLLQLQK